MLHLLHKKIFNVCRHFLYQICRLQLELNETAVHFEDYINKQMDSAQSTIVQLKRELQEKEQWVAILEEKNLKWRQLDEAAQQNAVICGGESSLADSLLRTEV